MLRLLLLIVAVVLFAIATLIAAGVLSGTALVWIAGGLLAWALAALVTAAAPYYPARAPAPPA